MPKERTDEDIQKIARQYNVGDLNLGYTLKTRQMAEQLVNAEALECNILPGRLVNRNYPERNWEYVWCPLDDSPYSTKFVADCKKDGYEPVTEAEWILNNEAWAWMEMEKKRFRWSVTNLLMNPYNEFLMYRDKEKWETKMNKRLNLHENDRIKKQEAAAESAARTAHNAGLEVELEVNGKPNIAGVRRTTVS